MTKPKAPTPVELDVQPLTPDRFADLAALFEEGGDPKWCWCTFFRVRGRDWNSNIADNRAELEVLATRNLAPGLVGYLDGRAVGWVSLAPRDDYERLAYSKVLAPVDETPVWSIVCFVVARRARGRGVASAMLHAAIAFARARGATVLEAYPADTGAGRIPAADAYRGTLAMFEKAGFSVVASRHANAASAPRPIVRLTLDPG
jgi:GNAT superfamily N-acetyltransferase